MIPDQNLSWPQLGGDILVALSDAGGKASEEFDEGPESFSDAQSDATNIAASL